jgi:hypothetical protein
MGREKRAKKKRGDRRLSAGTIFTPAGTLRRWTGDRDAGLPFAFLAVQCTAAHWLVQIPASA